MDFKQTYFRNNSFPNVSVLMSVYNEDRRMLEEAVNSILSQSYTDFEFLIVLDNPEAIELRAVLEMFEAGDKRISIIYNEKNEGLAKSLNKALSVSRGKYIARMDADDISRPDRFQYEVSYLDKNINCDLVYTERIVINENGKVQESFMRIPKNDRLLMKSVDFASIIVHPAVMMRKAAIQSVGGYNSFYASQDYDLWLRMQRAGYLFHCIEIPLLYYRIRDNSTTSQKGIIQYISAMYSRKLVRENRHFDAEEYDKFVIMMKKNSRFVKYQKWFLQSFNEPFMRKMCVLINCFLSDRVVRRCILDSLRMCRCTKKVRISEKINVP